jgi:3-oxoadipate enol-lactonase
MREPTGGRVVSGGCSIAWEAEGAAGAPPLLLINSIAATRALWDRQAPALAGRFRVIRYDARGHGQSSVPAGEYALEQLGRDAAAVLEAAGAPSAGVCGLSLGGLTALWLAVHEPGRVTRLVLANTAARIGSVESWTDRIALVRARGMRAVADLAIPLWFTQAFREHEAGTVDRFRAMIEACPPAGYLGCCAALRDADLREAVAEIRCPVLAIAGRHDVPTPPEALRLVHERLPGSRMLTLDAAHLGNVEQAEAFNDAVLEFLA